MEKLEFFRIVFQIRFTFWIKSRSLASSKEVCNTYIHIHKYISKTQINRGRTAMSLLGERLKVPKEPIILYACFYIQVSFFIVKFYSHSLQVGEIQLDFR